MCSLNEKYCLMIAIFAPSVSIAFNAKLASEYFSAVSRASLAIKLAELPFTIARETVICKSVMV